MMTVTPSSEYPRLIRVSLSLDIGMPWVWRNPPTVCMTRFCEVLENSNLTFCVGCLSQRYIIQITLEKPSDETIVELARTRVSSLTEITIQEIDATL